MARKIQDFTVGKPGKKLLLFSVPLIITMVLQNLYNMADSVIVGRFVNENALAAVGTSGSVTLVVLMLISGATQGASVIMAQFIGAKDEMRVKKTIMNACYIIIGLSILFGALGMIFSRAILRLINVPEENNILNYADLYLKIIFAGSVFTGFYNMANATSRALGDSVTPMIVLVITSVLNVGLNILFVTAFGMTTDGVAYATVIATIISGIVCWIILWKKAPMIRPNREALKFDPEIVKMIVRIGIPSALQSSTTSIGALLMQSLVNGFGGTVMAAMAGATKIEALVSYPPGGITQGTQVFTGQNVGAGKFDRVKEGFIAGIKIIAVYSVFSALVMILAGKPFMGLFTTEGGEIVKIGYIYLVICGVGVFFCGLTFQTRAVLAGAGDATVSAVMSVLEIVVRVISAFLLSRYTPLGYIGVFLGTPIGWIVAGAFGLIRYKNGKWKEKRLVKDAAPAEG